MQETDFILMMTAGFLLAPEEEKKKWIGDFETAYELNEPRAPGKVSIGAGSGEQAHGWKAWLDEARRKKVAAVSVTYIPYDRAGLAPHIAAAFAGVVSYVLQVETREGKQDWYLRSENSPRAAISAARFADFIDGQPAKSLLWNRIHTLINESNGLNNRPLVPEGQTDQYLRGPEGETVFDFLGDNLLSESQIECVINSETFLFPDEFDSFFDPPFAGTAYFSATNEKEPVYFYLLREVTAGELKEIISVQPFAGKIISALKEQMATEPSLDGATEPDPLLSSGTNDQLQTLGNLVCRIIAAFCQEEEILPVLPEQLKETFGPDETDQRRARARGHTEKFRTLKQNQSPWRYYQFEQLNGFEPPAAGLYPASAATGFRDSLKAISQFAAKHETGFFAELFRLAVWVSSSMQKKPAFDAEQIASEAKDAGFGDNMNASLTDAIGYISRMNSLRWPAEKCFALLAVALTGVFGGMGSWNDLYFDNDTDTYNKVSADFFLARQLYFADALSCAKALE